MAFNLDKKYIKNLEIKLNSTLPLAYKNAMESSNGGVIFIDDENWEIFPIPDTSSKKRISRTINNVLYETNRAKTWNNFSDDLLAIASNGLGDFLVLVKDENIFLDNIYTWEHETGKITKIADTFDKLDIE